MERRIFDYKENFDVQTITSIEADDSIYQYSHNNSNEEESCEHTIKSSLIKLKIGSPEISSILKDDCISDSTHKVLKGQYGEIIKQKTSCRIFQQLLLNTGKPIITDIFNELKENLSFYLTDVYSNYFLQKLYSYLDIPIYNWQHEGSRVEYLEIVFRDFLKISCNSVGTFVVQKLIDSFDTQIEREMLFAHITNMPSESLLMIAAVSIYY